MAGVLVINGRAGKTAALIKFSDTLTLPQPRGEDYAHQLALPHLKFFSNYAPVYGWSFTNKLIHSK